MTISLEISTEDILTQVKMSQMIPAINEKIILTRIIENEAEQTGIKLEVAELQEAADNFRKNNNLVSTRDTEVWLRSNQLSLDEFESLIRLQLLSDKLTALVLGDRVEQYFYQHQMDFDSVALYEIVLKDRELAVELYYAIREGELKFRDVANQYVEDIELRRKSGYLGQFRRRDLNPELSSVFSVVNPPHIAKPITTGKGHHLLWIEELVKAELNEDIHKEIRTHLFREFLREKAIYFMSQQT